MAEEQAFDFEDDDVGEQEASGKRSRKLVVAVVVVSSLLGAVVGGGVVAPKVAGGSDVEAHDDGKASKGGHGGGGGHGDEGGGNIVEFENVIVNPAGSDGLRFLMATVAFELPSSDEQELLRERKLQVRDRVTSVLEAQTIEMLTARGARDSLKVLLRHVLDGFVDDPAHAYVYIPHFVIQ